MMRRIITTLAALFLVLPIGQAAWAAEFATENGELVITGTDVDETVYVQIGEGSATFNLEPGQTQILNGLGDWRDVAPFGVWVDGTLAYEGFVENPRSDVELGGVTIWSARTARPVVYGLTESDEFQPWFADIARSVHRQDIVWLAQEGITHGCTPTRFCPEDDTERGQMAKFLHLASGIPANNGAAPAFDDIAGSVFVDHINTLAYYQSGVATGIVDGCSTYEFCPTDKLARRDMVRWLHWAGVCGYALYPEPVFNDVTPGDPDRAYIEGCYASGITFGYDSGNFGPNDPVTRGQMASFLRRSFG